MNQITNTISLIFLVDQDRVLLTSNNDRPNKITWNGIASQFDATTAPKIINDIYRLTKISMYEHDLKQIGMLHYFMVDENDNRQKILSATLYRSDKWQGEAINTTGIRPTWFDFDQIPYADMTQDCKEWLPKILDGDKIIAEIYLKVNPVTQEESVTDIMIREVI